MVKLWSPELQLKKDDDDDDDDDDDVDVDDDDDKTLRMKLCIITGMPFIGTKFEKKLPIPDL